MAKDQIFDKTKGFDKTKVLEKTIVMRILEQKHISYESYMYNPDKLDAISVAQYLNEDYNKVFKTLVVKGNKYYVLMVPSIYQVDLKKVAKLLGEKSIQMIKQAELFPLTGYVHGGCSPIGMKKVFPTIIDESSKMFDEIIFSAGLIGRQVKLKVSDLIKLTNALVLDIKGEKIQ